jgi:predicted RNA-binding protein YlqC (UPF0109 family)
MNFTHLLPVVAVVGGAAYLYSQCTGDRKKVAKAKANKTPQKSPSDDEILEPDDFLTPKQRKELALKEQRQIEQQTAQKQLKDKKEKEEQRRIAAAKKARLAAAAAAEEPQQDDKKTKSDKKADKKKEISIQEQKRIAEERKQAAALKKKEEKKRQAELEAKMIKQMEQQQNKNGGQQKETTKKENKKAQIIPQEDDWKPVMSKRQRQRQNELKHADSDDDDSDIEIISSSNAKTDDQFAPEVKVEKVRIAVAIPEKQRMIIIGKGGETIEAIKAKTECWISVPKDEDLKKDHVRMYNVDAPVYVVVEGPKPNTVVAKKIILELVEKGFSPTLIGGMVEVKVNIDPNKRSLVIGPKGLYMDLLQRELQVKIILPERLSSDGAVTIAGSRENVAKCKKAITQLVETGYSNVTHPNWTKESIPFSSSYRRRLIGRAGQVIKSLQSNTGCRISFPEQSDKDIVYITGARTNISAAIKAIQKIVEQIEFDEEADAVAALKSQNDSGDEIDEDLAQYMYIPDEDY